VVLSGDATVLLRGASVVIVCVTEVLRTDLLATKALGNP
jgi:hypothetical protein